jgi:spore photoproduct lyase
MISYCPEQILVQEQSWEDAATRRILEKLPGIQTKTIQDAGVWLTKQQSCSTPTLILMRYPGKFLRPCQGSGAEICCNYMVVSYAWNCYLECTYCILQSYLGHRAMVVCTNIEDLLIEIRDTLGRSPNRLFRIGTGELADSLLLDDITYYSPMLVSLFASLPNGILELKTKSDRIENLGELDHRGHTVISWSMNSRHICSTEELKAPAFEERLAAALRCQQWGYRLGFHFDPLVYYEGWESGYREVVREIFDAVDPGKIAWVSLGALRFPPHLREVIQQEFPHSRLPYGEFVPGHHGKLRYFRPIREEMYRKMRAWISESAPDVLVYLCMESRFVWERSFGESPCSSANLGSLLDARVAGDAEYAEYADERGKKI